MLSDYFEAAAQLAGPGKAQAVGNWIVNDLLRELSRGASAAAGDAALRPRSAARDAGVAAPSDAHSLATSKVRPAHIAALVNLVDAGTVLTNAAKEIFIEMAATGDQPDAIAEQRGLRATPIDTNELETWCRDAIAANPKAVAEFKSGKDSAINALKGPVMKAAKGKANPKLVDETLRRLLAVL
jgi:aspartyl-tRNA(Asn)/glutamyl-tRNA(Gln) amidotransferase subunit B